MASALVKTFAGSLGRIAFTRSLAETDRDQAHARWREVADTLRDRCRDVAELMDGEGVKRSIRGIDRRWNEHDALAYMAFDESLRAKLHSTTPLERVNKEIKRRTNVVGFGGQSVHRTACLSASRPNRDAVLVRASRLTVGASAMGLGPSPSSLGPMAQRWQPASRRTAGAK